jgi:hypothetical protein
MLLTFARLASCHQLQQEVLASQVSQESQNKEMGSRGKPYKLCDSYQFITPSSRSLKREAKTNHRAKQLRSEATVSVRLYC